MAFKPYTIETIKDGKCEVFDLEYYWLSIDFAKCVKRDGGSAFVFRYEPDGTRREVFRAV